MSKNNHSTKSLKAATVPVGAGEVVEQIASAQWEAAIARYRVTNNAMESLSAECRALHDKAEAECPRRPEFFRRYHMGHGFSREQNARGVIATLFTEPGEHDETKISAEVERVLADFEDYCAKHDAAFAEYDRKEKLFDEAVDQRHKAMQALFATPVPDNAAFLSKFVLLAIFLDSVDSEDAKAVAAVLEDALRLFGEQ